jgi:hypothetical protein
MQNQPIPQRVQQDEVDAAATAYGPSMVVDKTHAGFGVVKDTKPLTLSTISGVRLAKRMGRSCLLARGDGGLKLTQGGRIVSDV